MEQTTADVRVRRLGPGDEDVLSLLDREDSAFDAHGRGAPRGPLAPAAARAYLTDPDVLHWVAEDGGFVVGHVLCYVQPRRRGDARQLMLYEIGVRSTYRRRGVGRLLLAAADGWMAENAVRKVWVPSTEEATPFYEACGFTRDGEQPIQMSRTRRRNG